MKGTPTKGKRLGGSAKHQRLMLANLVSSLMAAERIVTTEAKAKALRPVAEKVITKAAKGGLHNHRQILAFLNDTEIADTLMEDIGPRYADRPGGYTRILKLMTSARVTTRRCGLNPKWVGEGTAIEE
jgi:large subunit ribosomal protein L17